MAVPEVIQINRRIGTLALMVSLGVVLHRLETLIPLPSPWVKLGLANVMTLVTLVFMGFRDALTVTLLRVIIGSILLGTFLSPTFFLSLIGGLAATFTMGIMYYHRKGPFSLIGVSICASYANTFTVILCVYFFLIRQEFFFEFLPIFFTFALITGTLTGIVGNFITRRLTTEKVSLV